MDRPSVRAASIVSSSTDQPTSPSSNCARRCHRLCLPIVKFILSGLLTGFAGVRIPIYIMNASAGSHYRDYYFIITIVMMIGGVISAIGAILGIVNACLLDRNRCVRTLYFICNLFSVVFGTVGSVYVIIVQATGFEMFHLFAWKAAQYEGSGLEAEVAMVNWCYASLAILDVILSIVANCISAYEVDKSNRDRESNSYERDGKLKVAMVRDERSMKMNQIKSATPDTPLIELKPQSRLNLHESNNFATSANLSSGSGSGE